MRLRLAIFLLCACWASGASAQERLSAGALSFAAEGSSWSVCASTGSPALNRQDGAVVTFSRLIRLFPEHKNPRSAPLLAANALCPRNACKVGPVAERFATSSGPDVYRVKVLRPGADVATAYLVELDSYYFTAEASGLREHELLQLLAGARTELEPPSAVADEAPPAPRRKRAVPELSALAPSPEEVAGFDGWILAAQVAALLALAMLGLRLLLPERERPRWGTSPDSPYPIRLCKRYYCVRDTFDIKDAHGNSYRLTSADPALLLKAGLLLFAASKVLAAVAVSVAGVSGGMLAFFSAAPRYCLFMALCGLASALTFKRSFRMRNNVSGTDLLAITPGLSPAGRRVFHLYDASDKLVSVLEQENGILSLARRRWRLKDPQGNTHIEFIEDNSRPALARKLLGHCWGLLRTGYIVQERYGAMGEVRPFTISQNYTVYMNSSATDHRVVAAMAAVVYLVTPDKWHPWFS